MFMRWLVLVMVMLLGAGLAAAPGIALAQEPDAGRWNAQLSMGGGFGWEQEESLLSTSVGVGYYFMDDMSVNVNMLGYRIWQHERYGGAENAYGLGAELIGRWEFYETEYASLFMEGGAGLFQGSERVPGRGTQFNVILTGGVGILVPITDSMSLETGIRHIHLSNASMEGTDDNPGAELFNTYMGVRVSLW